MDGQRTTVFIHSRPVRGSVGVQPALATHPAKRNLAWVPRTILLIFIGLTLLAPLVFWLIWLAVVPVWFCWVWGFNDNRPRRG